MPRIILEYRGLAKLRSTYTDKLPEMVNPHTGRVHTSYHQAGAATGRLSSSDPNLQNIPIRSEDGRRIRTAFVAPPGRILVACDYSQVELRIMAHLSEDAALVRAFEQGADIHRATAADIIKRAMLAVDAWLDNHRQRALMILQVHDELVFEVDADFAPELLQHVPTLMTSVAQLRVPLVVDCGSGQNWDQAH